MLARGVSAFRLALALGMFTGPALAGSPIDAARPSCTQVMEASAIAVPVRAAWR